MSCCPTQDQQSVACVERLREPPFCPKGRAATPRFAAVFNIVMDQREIVDELNRSGRRHGTLPGAIGGRTDKQGEQWPDALAALSVSPFRPAEVEMDHLPHLLLRLILQVGDDGPQLTLDSRQHLIAQLGDGGSRAHGP